MFGECLCGRHYKLYGYGLCLGNVCVVDIISYKAMVCVWGMSVW